MYLENSPLCVALGKTPTMVILSFFMAHRDFDYTKTDIAKNTGLSRQTVYRGLAPLERFGLIKKNRKLGATTLYVLNGESEVVQNIVHFNKSIVKLLIEEQKYGQSPVEKVHDQIALKKFLEK